MHVLELNNITKTLGKNVILDDVSFSVDEGQIAGFVGPNGSGKTTTMKTITNLIFPDQGSVTICGYNLIKEREKALSNISAIVENPGLYYILSGKRNLEFVRSMNNIPKEKMEDIISFIGLGDKINKRVKNYSLGMKQRLALGMSLLTEPKVLILDEPTNGLDPDGVMNLRRILIKMAQEKKMAILISSHSLSEIEKICDKIIFIKAGKIITEKEVKPSDEQLIYRFNFNDIDKAVSILKENNIVYKPIEGSNELLVYTNKQNLCDMIKIISLNDLSFDEMNLDISTIEKQYAEIYGEGN